MNDIKKYKSIVDKKIIKKFDKNNLGVNFDLLQYSTWKCGIDGIISTAYLLCPNFVQIKDYIFIEDFLNANEEDFFESIEIIEKQYKYDKKMVEMSVNSWSLGDLFLGNDDELLDDEKVLEQFGEILVYFWKHRVQELFPEKHFRVELGYEIMGEYGLSITLYEVM